MCIRDSISIIYFSADMPESYRQYVGIKQEPEALLTLPDLFIGRFFIMHVHACANESAKISIVKLWHPTVNKPAVFTRLSVFQPHCQCIRPLFFSCIIHNS